MPNTPCLVGAGAAGIALGSRAGEEEGKLPRSYLLPWERPL